MVKSLAVVKGEKQKKSYKISSPISSPLSYSNHHEQNTYKRPLTEHGFPFRPRR